MGASVLVEQPLNILVLYASANFKIQLFTTLFRSLMKIIKNNGPNTDHVVHHWWSPGSKQSDTVTLGHTLCLLPSYIVIGSCHFTGSSARPNEDKLLKHLFDTDYQPNNLMTIPIQGNNETLFVIVKIGFQKLIALVKSELILLVKLLYVCRWFADIFVHYYRNSDRVDSSE